MTTSLTITESNCHKKPDIQKLTQVVEHFNVPSKLLEARQFGNGHLHDTYALLCAPSTGKPQWYVFQRLHPVFKDPDALMDNITRVTSHQRNKHTRLEAVEVVLTKEAKAYFEDDEGRYWRGYVMILDATSYETVTGPMLAKQAGIGFGRFLSDLSDFPDPPLKQTIAGFRDLKGYFDKFTTVVLEDPCNRTTPARSEIDAIVDLASLVDKADISNRKSGLKRRVVHYDAKLNNVLIDNSTGVARAIVDLDTVNNGLCIYDFGDLVRTAACYTPEDQEDVSQASLDINLFEALCSGWLEYTAELLMPPELELLCFGAQAMTYEAALRFLTDYLQGDIYYKIQNPQHNLIRCRSQLALCNCLISNQTAMEDVILACRPK
ncbi:MAG: aminoglycoside phosphotransferase family protein [Actinobacteria bacterium]|nr:aminoglycoside phosphotransferase family protein [Actinomycetota bacterium]MCL6104973.1 aminoglycoside phosphotransferase family protein [Actinomycetota bacterium]